MIEEANIGVEIENTSEKTPRSSAIRDAEIEIERLEKEVAGIQLTLNAAVDEREEILELYMDRLNVEQAIAEIAHRLIASEEVDRFEALATLGRILEVDNASFYVCDDDTDRCEMVHRWSSNAQEDQVLADYQMNQETLAWISGKYSQSHPESVPDLDILPEQQQEKIRQLDPEKFRSIVATCLYHEQTLLGVLVLTHSQMARHWIDSDLRTFVITAELFSAYLRRSRESDTHKALETQLRQAQKMEAIGTLAGGIAHDFNNLLVPIIGYAELLMLELPPDGQAHDQVHEIRQAGKHAKDLIAQILAFSRKREGETQKLALGSIVKESIKLLRSSLPSSIEIDISVAEDLKMIRADPTQMHQVLMNLCVNASHAMPDGGTLFVSLANVSEEGFPNPVSGDLITEPFIELCVRDTGIGMDEQTLAQVYEPYFTTKPPEKGTGLGLAMVHGIVYQIGGHINITSEPGKGAMFQIYLPAIEQSRCRSNGNNITKQVALPSGNESILVVDDDPKVVRLTEMTLTRAGFRVTTIVDSITAFETFRFSPKGFDLVITDQTMPRMRGTDLAPLLHEIRPDIPIILYTGVGSQEICTLAQQAGIIRVLQKPIVGEELTRAVREVLDNNLAAEGST